MYHIRGVRRSLQCHQCHVILLLPSVAGKAFEFAQQDIDERCLIGMRFEQLLQARKPEHLTPGIMSLHEAVAVEEEALSRCYSDFMLFVAAPGQHPKWHARGPQFRSTPLLLAVGRLMSCIGRVQPPALEGKYGQQASC